MRKMWLVGMLLLAVAGCADEQASTERKVRDAQLVAVSQLERVEAGYVPDPDSTMQLQAYRQSELPAVAKTLEPIIGQGTVNQQVATNRLLAQVHTSGARHLTRQALETGARIANRSAVLVPAFGRARGAAVAANRYDVDTSEAVGQLQEALMERQRAVDALQGQIDDFSNRIGARQAEMARLQTQAEQALSRAVSLRNDAFIETGEQQLKLYEEALTLERRASTAQSQQQSIAAQVGIWESEQQVVQGHLTMAVEARDRFAELLDTARKTQSDNQAALDDAVQSRDEAISEMESTLGGLQETFTNDMQKPLTDAVAKLDRAIELLQNAASLSSSTSAEQVRSDLLAVQLEKLNLLDGYLAVVRAYGSNVLLVATMGEPILGERRLFANTAARLQVLHTELVDKAKALIADARATAGELTDEQEILRAGDIIDRYAQHVETSALTVTAGENAATGDFSAP